MVNRCDEFYALCETDPSVPKEGNIDTLRETSPLHGCDVGERVKGGGGVDSRRANSKSDEVDTCDERDGDYDEVHDDDGDDWFGGACCMKR